MMKTFAISLAQNKERRNHIRRHLTELDLDFEIVDAVWGQNLSEEDLHKHCDMEEVDRLRWWLTDGAIGCALSHYKVYEQILQQNLDNAFIVEDDVQLPKNINNILKEIAKVVEENEIILLYYTSFGTCSFSIQGKTRLSDAELVYPMDIKQTMTATAYVIGRKAVEGMLKSILPVRVTADCWHHFYKIGALQSLRCLYPTYVKTKNFKSSIDYLKHDSFLNKAALLIDKYKIPLFYQLLKFRRKLLLNKMQRDYVFVNQYSPLMRVVE